jgi:hypothetical protein
MVIFHFHIPFHILWVFKSRRNELKYNIFYIFAPDFKEEKSGLVELFYVASSRNSSQCFVVNLWDGVMIRVEFLGIFRISIFERDA